MKLLSEILYALGMAFLVSAITIFLTILLIYDDGYGQDTASNGYYQTVLELGELNKQRTFATIDSSWRKELDRQVIELEKKSWKIIADTLWKPTEAEGFK